MRNGVKMYLAVVSRAAGDLSKATRMGTSLFVKENNEKKMGSTMRIAMTDGLSTVLSRSGTKSAADGAL